VSEIVGAKDKHLLTHLSRVTNLESTVRSLASGQNQIQMALQQILSMLPQNNAFSTTPSSVPSFLSHQDAGISTANIFSNSVSPPDIFGTGPSSGPGMSPRQGTMFPPPTQPSPQNTASGRLSGASSKARKRPQDFPKLPGFAPPVSLKTVTSHRDVLTPEPPIWHIWNHPTLIRRTFALALTAVFRIIQRFRSLGLCASARLVDRPDPSIRGTSKCS